MPMMHWACAAMVVSMFVIVQVARCEADSGPGFGHEPEDAISLFQRHVEVVKLSKASLASPSSQPKLAVIAGFPSSGSHIIQKLEKLLAHFDPFYQPVSPSVACVMAIITVNLVIATVFAIVVNRNECLTEPHVYLLDLLRALTRCSYLSPTFAALLIACRMHLLANTHELGHYPWWVNTCIYLVMVGVMCQFLLVISLSLVDDDDGKKRFHQKLGWPGMVHPWLNEISFRSNFTSWLFYWSQLAVFVLIYGSAVVIVVGMFQVAVPSPAIMCTLLLVLLYSLVALSNWFVHQSSYETPKWVIQLAHGMNLAVSTYQKTAMVSLLMLCDRERAMFLDPPDGKPQPWARVCFFIITATMYCNVGMCGYIAAVGHLKKGSTVFDRYYHAHPIIHVVKLCIHALFVGLLIAIVISIITLESSSGQHCLSPTVVTIFVIASVYFGAHELLEPVNFLIHVLGWASDGMLGTLHSALVATARGFTMGPLIGLLCLAVRMRALEITGGKGSPQSWAQQAMYASAFSLILYTVCGVIIPIFRAGGDKVDNDGNVDVELKPLMAAYVVQTMKYFLLVCLHASVYAICISVFMITPKTADYGLNMHLKLGRIIKFIGVGLLFFFLALVLSSAKMIGLGIKYGIESIEMHGVTFSVDKAVLGMVQGYVFCSNVIINNPRGISEKWSSEYLMKSELLVLQVNVWRLLSSFGKELEIQRLIVHGVHLNFEKDSLRDYSNLDILLHGTPEEQKQRAAAEKANKTTKAQCLSKIPSICPRTGKQKEEVPKPAVTVTASAEPEKRTRVFLGLVDIEDISARIIRTSTGELVSVDLGGVKLAEGDLPAGDIPASEIAKIIFSTIGNTLYANKGILQKLLGTLLHEGVESAASVCSHRSPRVAKESAQPETKPADGEGALAPRTEDAIKV